MKEFIVSNENRDVVSNNDSGKLICWNCGTWTDPGKCANCGVQLKSPEVNNDEDEKPVVSSKFDISINKKKIAELNIDDLTNIVSSEFEIIKSNFIYQPVYLIKYPLEHLTPKFNRVHNQSNQLLNGLQPVLERVSSKEEELIIRFQYNTPVAKDEKKRNFILMAITFVSILLAGLYNSIVYNLAISPNLSSTQYQFSLGSLSHMDFKLGGSFTLILIMALLLKDFPQIYSLLKRKNPDFSLLYIPAPPFFELGTLGSILTQRVIHKNRKSLFYQSVYGPIISWFFSIIVFFISLPLSVRNAKAASYYDKHSLIMSITNHNFIIQYLTQLSHSLGMSPVANITELQSSFILHPITIAAMAGIYISFFSLLPATILNGGYIVFAISSKMEHQVFTYLVIILFVVISPIIALVLMFFHWIFKTPRVLDSVTSPGKLVIIPLIVIVAILILSFPFAYFIP